MIQFSKTFHPTFGKNTIYILDIDNTTVQTGNNAQVKNHPKKNEKLLGLLDDSDVLLFNTGRPKADINKILAPSLQDRASFLVTRLGTAIWAKTQKGDWTPHKAWDEKLKATGFDTRKIAEAFSQVADIFRAQKDHQVVGEYNEPFSACVVLGSDSPDVYLPFEKKVREAIELAGQRGFNLGHMAEKNLSVVMATPQGTSKGTSSDFIISEILETNPHIDKVLVAGDSKGDLTNFLIDTPSRIKDTLFAFVNPLDKNFFKDIFDGRELPQPKLPFMRSDIPSGYYPSAKVFVPENAFPAPKGLIEAIKFFKAR